MRGGPEALTVDAVVGGALAVASSIEIWSPRLLPGVGEVVGDRPVLTVTSLAATLPLAVRRRSPLAVVLAVMAALAVQQVLTTPTQGLVLLVAALLAAYSSSAYASPTRALAAGAVVELAAVFIGEDLGDWAFIAVVLGGAWLVGYVVMRRSSALHQARESNRDLASRLAQATHQLEESQQRSFDGLEPEEVGALTAREIEVARAIARGLSNAEIASELFISEWTVKTHVANILRKLTLRDRAQVVVAAYESGLVRPTQNRPAGRSTDTSFHRAAPSPE